ncbi:PAS domain-containing protein [Comamonas kerstersii]|uniref:PAS domain-containing protein n=1 Tax=Comamonas kerstersii TaxID=225992 RepID=UPI003D15FC5E
MPEPLLPPCPKDPPHEDSIHIVCPHYQSLNREPANKLAEKPNCGRCQHPLFTGEPIELTTATVEDITDLKRVEQALNVMRRQREELASHVPGMLYQYRLRPDGSSHFPYASARIQEIYGVTPEDVVEDATPVFAALHPEDRDRVHETIRASGQSLALWHDEYRVQFPDGRVIWVEGEALPEAMPDGSILWHGYIHDVTSRRRSAEELRLAAKVLVHHASTGYVVTTSRRPAARP